MGRATLFVDRGDRRPRFGRSAHASTGKSAPIRILSVGDPAMYAVYAFIRRSNMLIAIALKTCCRAASTESAATACLLERFERATSSEPSPPLRRREARR
jgi:hypothetical protein